MITAAHQLDRQFAQLKPALEKAGRRPPRGWIRAIRDALGMTTGQLAKRMGVAQPRISELERGEASGKITLHSLERAAGSMGCRVVYFLVPIEPLSQMIDDRAALVANRQMNAVDQTMRLEDQRVTDSAVMSAARARLIDELRKKPARLWDEV